MRPAPPGSAAQTDDLQIDARIIHSRARDLDRAGRCGEAAEAYRQYAKLARATDPQGADAALASARSCRHQDNRDPRTTQAVDALAAHDYATVLGLTESNTSPWLDYDRASALAGLERTDEAVEAFRRAELRFRQMGDDAGRASALWGMAYALDDAGRCDEARQAYEQYRAFVRLKDPHGAELAAAHSGTCRHVVLLQ